MMLRGISLRIGAELKAKGVPFPVVYGPERQDSTVASASRIVFERDRQNGDGIAAARSIHTNPRMQSMRVIGCVARVFAKSNVAGAAVEDHEGVADAVVDKLQVAIDKVVRSDQTLWTPVNAKFLTAEELEARGLKSWPGVVYELRFTIDRGVYDTTYAGEAAPEAELGGDGVTVQSTTQVKVNGVGGPETACGG